MNNATNEHVSGRAACFPIISAALVFLVAGPVFADVEDDDIFTFFKTEKLE